MKIKELAHKYPNVITDYVVWFQSRYQKSIAVFDHASLKQQTENIRRFLGYPIPIPDGMTIEEAADDLHEKLDSLGRLIQDKAMSGGVKDLIKDMLHMTEEEKLEAMPYLHNRQIYPTLASTLKKMKNQDIVILSLKDCLKDLKIDNTNYRDEKDDNLDFWNNTKIKDEAPF